MSKQNLKGIKVNHDFKKLKEGEEYELHFKDQNILDENNIEIAQTEDILESSTINEMKQIEKRTKNKVNLI